MIGKFEELTLLSLIRSGSNSYPYSIYKKLEIIPDPPHFSALDTTLNRLVAKGLVSRDRDSDADRYRYTITSQGYDALSEAIEATRLLYHAE